MKSTIYRMEVTEYYTTTVSLNRLKKYFPGLVFACTDDEGFFDEDSFWPDAIDAIKEIGRIPVDLVSPKRMKLVAIEVDLF